MYIMKWANAPMFNEKMTKKYWSRCQIKGQSLHVFNHHVSFFCNIGGFCEKLECNADAFQGLWHSEKERVETKGESRET